MSDDVSDSTPESPVPAVRKRGAAAKVVVQSTPINPFAADELRKPVNTLAIVPQAKKITPLFRKAYNVMLFLAQEQGIEKEFYRAPLSEVLSGLDFDSHDTALVKKHFRAMATTAVEWQSPTTGEGGNWAISGLIGHAELKTERGQTWLEWSYSVKLKHELLEPRVFARLSIEIISQLRSHAAIALYEICGRYRDVGRTSRQHWSWWRPVLSGKPETEKQKELEYRFFKRDVLKPAIAELNAISDLEIELQEFKQGRYTSDLQFLIKKKRQSALPLSTPPKPVDLSLIVIAVRLGVDENKAEQMLLDFGPEVLKEALQALERRLATAYPEPLRDPTRYLKALMPAESKKAEKRAEEEAEVQTAAEVAQKDLPAQRQIAWSDEWLRARKQEVIAQIEALSDEAQADLVNSLMSDMDARNVHPSLKKRLQTSGWRHPMVQHEMVRFYAQAAIGDGWDKPTAEQLLDIAARSQLK